MGAGTQAWGRDPPTLPTPPVLQSGALPCRCLLTYSSTFLSQVSSKGPVWPSSTGRWSLKPRPYSALSPAFQDQPLVLKEEQVPSPGQSGPLGTENLPGPLLSTSPREEEAPSCSPGTQSPGMWFPLLRSPLHGCESHLSQDSWLRWFLAG